MQTPMFMRVSRVDQNLPILLKKSRRCDSGISPERLSERSASGSMDVLGGLCWPQSLVLLHAVAVYWVKGMFGGRSRARRRDFERLPAARTLRRLRRGRGASAV